MINKLKLKFIVTLLLFVVAVLWLSYYPLHSNYTMEKTKTSYLLLKEAEAVKNHLLDSDEHIMAEKRDYSLIFFPDGGEPEFLEGDVVVLADAALADRDPMNGELSEFDVYYYKQKESDGWYIAFASRNHDQAAENKLLYDYLQNSAVILLITLGVGIVWSHFLVRPVSTAWKRQKQFVADASHELKTPLTVILADCNILASHPEATIASQQRWIGHIRSESERMAVLVNRMLQLAKSDSIQKAGKLDRICLSKLTWDLSLSFEAFAFENGGKKLVCDIGENIYVRSDEMLLRELISIFLDNACHYAAQDTEITVRLAAAGGKPILSIRNFGEPIPPEHLPHIFERFYRADEARTSHGGYGLGLAIAKNLASVLHIKIKVTSSRTEGTIFSLFF